MKVEDINLRIGRKIKELRNSKKFSQEEFAFKCDIDRSYLSEIEAGKRNISLNILEKISIGLEINLSDLFE